MNTNDWKRGYEKISENERLTLYGVWHPDGMKALGAPPALAAGIDTMEGWNGVQRDDYCFLDHGARVPDGRYGRLVAKTRDAFLLGTVDDAGGIEWRDSDGNAADAPCPVGKIPRVGDLSNVDCRLCVFLDALFAGDAETVAELLPSVDVLQPYPCGRRVGGLADEILASVREGAAPGGAALAPVLPILAGADPRFADHLLRAAVLAQRADLVEAALRVEAHPDASGWRHFAALPSGAFDGIHEEGGEDEGWVHEVRSHGATLSCIRAAAAFLPIEGALAAFSSEKAHAHDPVCAHEFVNALYDALPADGGAALNASLGSAELGDVLGAVSQILQVLMDGWRPDPIAMVKFGRHLRRLLPAGVPDSLRERVDGILSVADEVWSEPGGDDPDAARLLAMEPSHVLRRWAEGKPL